MEPSTNISGVRRQVAAILTRAADTHESGDRWQVDAEFEELETLVLSLGDSTPDDLFIVREFASGWEDARNHDWRYYEPLGADDWPRLAREISAQLINEEPITNSDVQKQFGPKAVVPRGCLGSLVGLWGGG